MYIPTPFSREFFFNQTKQGGSTVGRLLLPGGQGNGGRWQLIVGCLKKPET